MKEYVKISLQRYEEMKSEIEQLKQQNGVTTYETEEELIEWIVNDNGELGVKTKGRCLFLYKGYSIEYKDGKHDDGTVMKFRSVFKREFGECCISPLVNNSDWKEDVPSCEWRRLPIYQVAP